MRFILTCALLSQVFCLGLTATAPVCNPDNCMRELQDSRFSSKASTFCATYTKTRNTNPSAIPTYLENCAQNPSAVSSACSCIMTASVSASTSSPTQSPAAAAPQPDCHADNCARAVSGTYQGLQSSHKQDCSSFFRATVYPTTVTKTTTTTVYPSTVTKTVTTSTVSQTSTSSFTTTLLSTTSTSTVLTTFSTFSTTVAQVTLSLTTATETETDIETLTVTESSTDTEFSTYTANNKAKRATSAKATTVQPTKVPAYASPCTNSAEYSSACSCFGVSKTTVTMTTPTSTSTVTKTATSTVVSNKAATSQITTSGTTSTTSGVGYTTTVSVIETDSVTATTTLDFESFTTTTSTTSTSTSTTVTTESVTTVTPTPSASGNAVCENGMSVNGLSAPCATPPCASFNLRIEGATDTIYEGTILTGPQDVTTASGGTHLCNGQNNGANPNAGGTGITCLASAGNLCGFDFDGTFSNQFDDFFIQRIGTTAQNGNQFWGILNNFAFTPAGGCETEPAPGDSLLWAFNAFNVNFFLDVNPKTVTVTTGSVVVFTVTGYDGNGDNAVPIAGASFNGATTNANGQVVYVATAPGTYRIKATRSDSIRSPAAVITVTA